MSESVNSRLQRQDIGSSKHHEADSHFAAASSIVEKDLLRTFPTHPYLDSYDAPLIPPLRRVLHAFAWHNHSIGYCQGLNFIAAILLLHCTEATTFALLTTLCTRLLPNYHTPEMPGLHQAQHALIQMISKVSPQLHTRLTSEGVPIKEQTTSWLLCAFLDNLKLSTTLRVWDQLFSNDGQLALLRTAAACFALHEASMMEKPVEELYNLRAVLKCDEAELIAASLGQSIHKAALDAVAEAASDAYRQKLAQLQQHLPPTNQSGGAEETGRE